MSKVLTLFGLGASVSGHVLIIDALSNRRIQLRAQLDTSAYAVDLAESQVDSFLLIQEDPPDVVIIADDLPGLRLRQFCKSLRSQPLTQLTTIIVAVTSENHSARVSALSAGAHDVIDFGSDASELKARLRNFMRIKQSTEDVKRQLRSHPVQGLAEVMPEFAPKTVVTFIVPNDNAEILSRIAKIENEIGLKANVSSAKDAHRQPNTETDVYILFETSKAPEARDLLAALLSHPNSRHSRILFVTDRSDVVASPLDLGAHDQVSLSVSSAEFALRIQRLARAKQGADRARKKAAELGEKAYTDALTGVSSRSAMTEFLQKKDRALAEYPSRIAFLIVDVDYFKSINDNHGHPAGDEVLSHIASILKTHLREGDFIARYGGEEFLIVLPEVRPAQARSIAQRLRNTVAGTPKAIDDGTHVRATISIGVAHAGRSDRLSTKDLLRAADNALYSAKRNGRNRVEMATFQDVQKLPA